MGNFKEASNDKNEKPLISVIVACFNAERFIGAALESILSCGYENIEVLVMDDFSSDGSVEIVEEFAKRDERIILAKATKNRGPAAVRNDGFIRAGGEYIAICDADDLWDKDKLDIQLLALVAAGAKLCYTSYRFIDEDGKAIRTPYIVPESIDYKGIMKENVIGCSTVLMTKEIAKTYKMSSEYYHEDLSMWLALLRDGKNKTVGIVRPLVSYRIVAGARSFSKWRAMRERAKLLRGQEKRAIIPLLFDMIIYAIRGLKKHGGV